MAWELLKLYATILSGAVAVMAVAYWILCRIYDRPERSPDIRTTHHDGNWGYYFHDPYGSMISEGGFHSEQSAYRAAQRHRSEVVKELEEAFRL